MKTTQHGNCKTEHDFECHQRHSWTGRLNDMCSSVQNLITQITKFKWWLGQALSQIIIDLFLCIPNINLPSRFLPFHFIFIIRELLPFDALRFFVARKPKIRHHRSFYEIWLHYNTIHMHTHYTCMSTIFGMVCLYCMALNVLYIFDYIILLVHKNMKLAAVCVTCIGLVVSLCPLSSLP